MRVREPFVKLFYFLLNISKEWIQYTKKCCELIATLITYIHQARLRARGRCRCRELHHIWPRSHYGVLGKSVAPWLPLHCVAAAPNLRQRPRSGSRTRPPKSALTAMRCVSQGLPGCVDLPDVRHLLDLPCNRSLRLSGRTCWRWSRRNAAHIVQAFTAHTSLTALRQHRRT